MLELRCYTVQSKLYEGTERALYRGVRDEDGAPVVIKAIKEDRIRPKEVARLRHELSILQAIDWPGVIKAVGIEPCGQGVALILEDAGRSALSEHLRGGPLDVQRALRIARAIAQILAGVHAAGVIHKDIKPRNILVDDSLTDVQLIDFGIATRLSHEIQEVRRADTLEGTLAYISPEQTGRMNRAVDNRTDFYSLGVTLYEMLTGALPFDTTDIGELVHSHIARTPATPRERLPTIPEAVSAIVMKLLAKAAEDRYQQAGGLVADLDRCIAELAEKGSIEPFALGQRDISDRLSIPEKLYGREAEGEAMRAAFSRASEGHAGLVLVTGAAGVGKSALVQELHKAIAQHGGSFVAGKFDALHREVPFTAFTQAFRQLVTLLLGAPAAKLAAWKARLLDALGATAQVLIDLIPELSLVIGPQPPVPALGPMESQNRLSMTIQRFVGVLCTPSHPLVLFIDDLQWADAASLWLLRTLLAERGGHLLILGAYRDAEVDETHPLHGALQEMRKQGIEPSEIKLGPLDLPSVQRLLADTFRERDPGRVAPLSIVVTDKTHGNPFFLGQFLTELYTRKLVRLDRDAARWVWDVAEIAAAPVTDNVVDFMTARIQVLAPDTRRALSLAACVGHQFDLITLATIAERSPARTAAALWPALRERLIVPVGGDYRLLPATDAPDGAAPEVADGLTASYRFLHDRVQQAAYALIPADQREEVHLRIGRCLQSALADAPRAELLFDLVQHLNLGAARMRDREERVALSRLNLSAGRVARSAAAFTAAADLFGAGIAALGEQGWDDLYDLASSLHRERVECEYMAGRLDQAEAHIETLLTRLRSAPERADIFRLRTTLYIALGRFAEALAAGYAGLALVGINVPREKREAQAAYAVELAAIERRLEGRAIESLLDAPRVSDPAIETALRILGEVKMPAFFMEPDTYPFLVTKAVHLSIAHGNCHASVDIYVTFGFFVTGKLGRYAEAARFGKLALDLVERFDMKNVAHVAFFVLGYFMPFGEPLREALVYFDRARHAGLECGDLLYGSCAFAERCAVWFRLGEPLEKVKEDVLQSLAIGRRNQIVMAIELLLLLQQIIACLEGRTRSPTSLDDDTFDEEAWVARVSSIGYARHHYYLTKVQILGLHGDAAGAVAMIEAAEAARESAFGMHWTTELPFHAGLALAALHDDAAPDARPRLREELGRHAARLATFAGACPENTRHQQLLVAAEIARIDGNPSDAISAYEQAIKLAVQHGFPHHAAQANERYGKFFLARGQTRLALAYLSDARDGYARWGANVKVAALEAKHPALASIAETVLPRSPSMTTQESTHGAMAAQLLDVSAALQAAQAIASEIVVDRVIYRVMRIVLANAGAERGFMIMNHDGDLRVEAFMQVSPDTVQVGLNAALEARTDLAQSVVRLVARTAAPVVLSNAPDDRRFTGDPYVTARRPKSILCIPLTHQRRQRAVLYLENNAAEDAFTEGHIELLQMLCTQAAIAVENALLYTHVKAVSDKLERANQNLEAEVTDRTEALRAANEHLKRRTEELHRANERLQHELSEREKSERSRVELQDEVIRMQRNLLEELSTPLIPISEEITVLPLIGTVDMGRADRMLDTVLHGVERQRTRIVIVDITGMKQVDAQVAETLVRMTSALRLLGTTTILTGMRPEVARTLITLGVDLSQVATRGTLQSGIAYAVQTAGKRAQRA